MSDQWSQLNPLCCSSYGSAERLTLNVILLGSELISVGQLEERQAGRQAGRVLFSIKYFSELGFFFFYSGKKLMHA